MAGAFRGFGVPQSTIAHEALMDDLAEQIGMDRLEFRLLNAIRAGQADRHWPGAEGERGPRRSAWSGCGRRGSAALSSVAGYNASPACA